MSDTLTMPKAKSRPEYALAASWADDVNDTLRSSRRLALIVAGAAVAIAGLEAIALAALAPLKTVVPYTVVVDKTTGYAETVKGLELGKLTQDSALTQSFIVQYVLSRETFDATDLRDSYKKVGLWSAGEARAQYQHDMDRANANSPLNLYPATTTVSTTIKSVSLLSPTTALVRFDTTRRDAGSLSGTQSAWAAVLTFRYANAPMSMEDRFTNPLGFQVLRYRRDAESLAPATVILPGPPAATAAPTGASILPVPPGGFPNLMPHT